MTTTKRVAIYARVSTRDQNPETQLRQLRQFVEQRPDFEVRQELVDRDSGAKEDRLGLTTLMDLARSRAIDVVLVWKFDRFARSTKQLVTALEEFKSLGVDFISFTERVDTTTPTGQLVFTVFSAVAQFERALIRERVRAGQERARAEGIRLGRPALAADLVDRILAMRATGSSVREIGKALGVASSTVCRYASNKAAGRAFLKSAAQLPASCASRKDPSTLEQLA